MSALLAQATATFSYLGASVTLSCSSPIELKNALATFGVGNAANEGNVGATAPAGKPGSQTAAPSVQRAADKAAGDTGNAASTATPASAPPAAGGSAQAGDAGNANAGAPQGAGSAQTASADKPTESSPVTFDELKKAFLALSAKADGRAKCEGVLKPFGLAKLSEAKPEQYAAVLAEIQKASA